ncbi:MULTISPECIES: OmpP1/FadL family transporter [Mesorhizobium]|uniref:Aromatic hydrocarbon degradation protein n=1 Tax=Rhizobium loti TaxID=381 RepID=A0A6M7U185_RHILI|nr:MULTISPECIES: outer membrane protein transport protein [Mesorhizobium]KRB22506.1 aromatic hydrocarbon degradation protein [Mesorhizobium sp. Root172]OBQ62161.1 aromatic hydrocarbon degradation protein [Mesorhizobium loti]QKC71229.1 aromatic hydrocarbon degradation protein [Mesorhizobium loti]QKC90212.1 aromatic hydrocarbon degradation protein [Mesorhizobium sp. NZP2234]
MTNLRLKALLGAGCFSLALMGSAHAGGFSRGTADTDILFEDGNFNMRTSVTYVAPTRKYSVDQLNPNLVGVNYSDSYAVPSAAVKFKLSDNLSCAGTYTESYGGGATWPSPSGTLAKLRENFTIYEGAVTCGIKFDLSKGRIWILGGVYHEDVDYNLLAVAGLLDVGLKDSNVGWRAGVAYEIPEIALRAQLMYRSGVSIDASGSAVASPALIPFPVPGPVTVDATGDTKFPQSLEFKAQTGVAPGWLVYGSVKWTDWSVTKQLNLHIPSLGIENGNDYFWRDGWTVTGGVGHKFNDQLSGTVFASYDRGVSTGWDLTGDTYTIGTGVALKDKLGGELRFGVAAIYLASVSETQYTPSLLNRTVQGDWGYALSGGYSVKW